jgi:cytoskeleton protein RodZ
MAAADKRFDELSATDTPGRELAFARERLSMSLEEVSRRTKIAMIYLLAIENDDIEKLPGHFYARSFLRAYAREVHRDPEDIVRRFGIADESVEPKQLHDELLHLHTPVDVDDRRMARRLQLLGLAILVSGSFYVASGKPIHLSLLRLPAKTSVPTPPPAEASVVIPTSGTTSTPPPAPEATPKSAPSDGSLNIDVHSDDECWLTATADGQRVIYRLLDAGEDVRIEAHQEIVLRVGDAASMTFSINGAAGRPLGKAGEAVTIRVTPENYREFLNSQTSTERTHAGT